MSTNAFTRVLSLSALTNAWEEIYRKASPASRKTLAVDDSCLNDYADNYQRNLRKLNNSLRNGNFHFQELKPYRIPRPNGKKDRVICVPTVDDRVVQRALLNFLSDKYRNQLDNTVSFGFVSGRSVKDAADKACRIRRNHPWIFKTDITSFFDNIDRKLLRERISKIVKEKTLHPILFAVLDCEIQGGKRSTADAIKKLGIVRGKGIRQGMPLSPLLSNLFLIPFDSATKLSGAKAVRYADDLIFMADSEEECRGLLEFCKAEFKNLSLTIPELFPGSKSEIYEPNSPAEFLGLELTGQDKGCVLRLSDSQFERIRAELLKYGSIKELLSQGITMKSLGASINAKRNGYLAAYDVCTNITEVTDKLMDIEKKALRNLYREGLGLDLKVLSAEARTFLGI
ncbi:reverse transcriptase domain-containing protein [Orrella marina]|nr:reverse transcriptase domain-containing protein [Orrella marina]